MLTIGTVQTPFDKGSEYGNISPQIDVANFNMPVSDCVVANKGDCFELNSTQSSLLVSFDAGSQARIGGAFYFLKTSASITLQANQTQYICLEINTSYTTGQTGDIVLKTKAQIQKGNLYAGGVRDLPIYKVVTNASSISSIEDLRFIAGNTYPIKESDFDSLESRENYATYDIYED